MKKYTESHEWISSENSSICRVGITDYAQKELGKIVYIELPQVGSHVQAGQEIVVLESTKAATDVYCPVTGKILEVNTILQLNPEKVNEAAETEGWLFTIQLSNMLEVDLLMSEQEYKEML